MTFRPLAPYHLVRYRLRDTSRPIALTDHPANYVGRHRPHPGRHRLPKSGAMRDALRGARGRAVAVHRSTVLLGTHYSGAVRREVIIRHRRFRDGRRRDWQLA